MPSGVRRPLAPAGVLIGRSPECDIVVTDPEVSRRHVLLYAGSDGPQLVPLGRGGCRVDGKPASAPCSLRAGARVSVGPQDVEIVADHEATDDAPRWVVQRVGGSLFGIPAAPFSVGGGDEDDLHVATLPSAALVFYFGTDRLIVETSVPAMLGERAIEPAAAVPMPPGVTLQISDERFMALEGGALGNETTQGSSASTPSLPERVSLEFLPRGGRLSLVIGGTSASVYLSERRCELAATLLRPPAGYRAGHFVADEVLVERVWPRQAKGRLDLNVLVYRLRKDLLAAGVDGCAVIERADGSTRFAVAPDAAIDVC